ncbi:MAG: aminotransferase class I/II-fold pyridoxal phosphate-dependent enzyme [Spirochaetes bacterium]|jgi:aspartate/methionine/tyrosine aminotransferase|nr:aminotransferase class I/II-fold pyridoxal phosphate-dependent enzyme [Spirochaetota bacterium]
MSTNRIARLAGERRRAGEDILDLIDTNFHNTGFRFSQARMSELLSEYAGLQHYAPDPKGNRATREAVADYYAAEAPETAVTAEEVIVTASTSDSYNLLFSVLAEAGDNIVLPSPGYPLFEYLAHYHGLEMRFYSMDFDERFALRADRLHPLVDQATRLVVLISPNNPTGRVYSVAEIAAVGEVISSAGATRSAVGADSAAANPGPVLICDEVFSEYRYAAAARPAPLPRPMELLPDIPVVTLNGASKLLALPDLKLGWMALTGPPERRDALVEALETANDMFLNASGPAQHVGAAAIPERSSYLKRALPRLEAARDALAVEVERVPELETVLPEGGIHAVLRLPAGLPLSDEEFALRLLDRHNVHLHPGYLYGIQDDRSLILSLLPGAEAIGRGVAAIAETLRAF